MRKRVKNRKTVLASEGLSSENPLSLLLLMGILLKQRQSPNLFATRSTASAR